jgi:hypothetical protein
MISHHWPNVRCSENFNEESHGHIRIIAKIKLVNTEIEHVSDGYLEHLDRSYRPGDLHKLDEAHHVGEVGPAGLLAMTAIDLSSEYFSRRALLRDSSRRSTGEISSE